MCYFLQVALARLPRSPLTCGLMHSDYFQGARNGSSGVVHSAPLQFAHPEWGIAFDVDQEAQLRRAYEVWIWRQPTG
jgi:hypothetical protein